MAKYNPRKRLSFDELRRDVQKIFPSYDDLLDMQSSNNVDSLINKIKDFVQKNQRGISSSQLRAVFDRIEQTADTSALGKVGFRSFLAFKIVSQREDGAKRILLLLEELANHVTKTNATNEKNNRTNYLSISEVIVSFHKYAEVINLRFEEDTLRKAINDFKGRSNISEKELLNFSTSSQLRKLMDLLKSFIANVERGVTTHQLRNIYNKVMETNDLNQLKLLRPFFAYTIARQGNDKAQRLMLLIDHLVKSSSTQAHFENIKKLIETIVAFHKYYQTVPRKKEDFMVGEVREFFKTKNISSTDLLNRKKLKNYQEIEDHLKAFILRYQKDLSSSQLRKIYDMVKDLDSAQKIQMVRPKMGYAIARQKKDSPRKVLLLIEDLTSKVTDDSVRQYQELLEDIIAYHEYFEIITSEF